MEQRLIGPGRTLRPLPPSAGATTYAQHGRMMVVPKGNIVPNAAESVRNNRHPAAHRPRAARPAADRLEKQAMKEAEDLQGLGGLAGTVAQERLGELCGNAADRYAEGQEKVHQAERRFENFIRERPVTSILIAAGVGLVLGRFWMRR